MVTIPLADVVAFLQRRGAPLACLEGAPWLNDDGELGVLLITSPFIAIIQRPDQEQRAHTNALYLGTGPVCPAAMGWAQRLLSAAREPDADGMWIGGGRVELWMIGCDDATHRWIWDVTSSAVDEAPERTYLPGVVPEAPAARLKAVLEYEMGRR